MSQQPADTARAVLTGMNDELADLDGDGKLEALRIIGNGVRHARYRLKKGAAYNEGKRVQMAARRAAERARTATI